jgi:hypothetical protein
MAVLAFQATSIGFLGDGLAGSVFANRSRFSKAMDLDKAGLGWLCGVMARALGIEGHDGRHQVTTCERKDTLRDEQDRFHSSNLLSELVELFSRPLRASNWPQFKL